MDGHVWTFFNLGKGKLNVTKVEKNLGDQLDAKLKCG